MVQIEILTAAVRHADIPDRATWTRNPDRRRQLQTDCQHTPVPTLRQSLARL
ncbi:MAG: hypothetical protein JOZ78_15565 [Chroococcidiopsidaceae cyanobacterium CP_BM_ER_R8_30]|nr:hypothetical protein [Chroococcidiopsidaceae cyanobacterium CP_BM_ER_R8_30]